VQLQQDFRFRGNERDFGEIESAAGRRTCDVMIADSEWLQLVAAVEIKKLIKNSN
jgi:regulator of extracellular matrix RemA (YlzA/DUF370 family)